MSMFWFSSVLADLVILSINGFRGETFSFRFFRRGCVQMQHVSVPWWLLQEITGKKGNILKKKVDMEKEIIIHNNRVNNVFPSY